MTYEYNHNLDKGCGNFHPNNIKESQTVVQNSTGVCDTAFKIPRIDGDKLT